MRVRALLELLAGWSVAVSACAPTAQVPVPAGSPIPVLPAVTGTPDAGAGAPPTTRQPTIPIPWLPLAHCDATGAPFELVAPVTTLPGDVEVRSAPVEAAD